jgi:glutathione S-transferase
MYQLHIANKNYSSWSLRPWVLLTTLGIPFTEHKYALQGYGNNPHFKAFSPTALVPCLVDGDLHVWDSLAIVEYVAETYPAVWPSDKNARAFARSAAAEMHSGFGHLRNVCGMNCGVRVRLHNIDEALQKQLVRLNELWTDGLQRFGGPYLAGAQFTAVDAFYCPVAFRVQTYNLPLAPRAQAYVERLLALPAMQAWYAAGLAETERDDAHEAEVTQHGVVTQDLRKTAA